MFKSSNVVLIIILETGELEITERNETKKFNDP